MLGAAAAHDQLRRRGTDKAVRGNGWRVIAFYQAGYGLAAFGVGPLQKAGLSLSAIFGLTVIVAAALALLSFVVTPRKAGTTGTRVSPC